MQHQQTPKVVYYAPQTNPYYEYTIEGELTPAFEERTSAIMQQTNNGILPFTLVKLWDEKMDASVESERKKRVVIIVSDMCIIGDYIKNTYFRDCYVNITCFYKQRIII